MIFFFLGLAFGSFLNVLIYRLPKNESIISPGSHCPFCGHRLSWWENIPLFSYIILGARCRKCKKKISLQYPVVELLMGLMTYLIYLRLIYLRVDIVIYFPFLVFLIGSLIVISLIDFQHMIIPDQITYPGIVIGILYSLILGKVVPGLIGIAIGGGIIYLIRFIGGKFYKTEVMGGGDVKLCLMLGGFLHPAGMLMTLVLGSLFGAIFGLILMTVGRKSRVLPFGPFLALGAVVSLFFFHQIIELYLKLIRF